jgi:hypothetical protein
MIRLEIMIPIHDTHYFTIQITLGREGWTMALRGMMHNPLKADNDRSINPSLTNLSWRKRKGGRMKLISVTLIIIRMQ